MFAFPAIAALADGFQCYGVIDAPGDFTRTQVDMGVLRMQQAGVVPVRYSHVTVEPLADCGSGGRAVYEARGIPFRA